MDADVPGAKAIPSTLPAADAECLFELPESTICSPATVCLMDPLKWYEVCPERLQATVNRPRPSGPASTQLKAESQVSAVKPGLAEVSVSRESPVMPLPVTSAAGISPYP